MVRKIGEITAMVMVLVWVPAAIVALLVSVWTSDLRWFYTAVIMFVIFAGFVWALIAYTRSMEPTKHTGKRSIIKREDRR